MIQGSIGKKSRVRGVKDEITTRSRARRATQTALVTIQRNRLGARRNDPAPYLRFEMVEAGALQVGSRQVRRRDAVQAAKLKASVERCGVVKPVLINARNEVIEGHGVLEAAKALGVEKIPAIVIDHLDPAQQRMLRLALNRLGETGVACGRDLGLELLNLVVWAKSNAGHGSLWRSQHELAPFFKKGAAAHVNNVQLGRHGRWRSNIWTYAGGSSLGSDARAGLAFHPMVKPRIMLEDALLDVTHRDEIVIDPFVGSGSTLLAAETTGRVCRAIEIDGQYCDVVIRRWQDLTGDEAVLERTGERFAEIATARTDRTEAGQ